MTPRQTDGYNCGAFVGMIGDHYLKYGLIPPQECFDSSDINECRLFMAYKVMMARNSVLPRTLAKPITYREHFVLQKFKEERKEQVICLIDDDDD